VGTERFTPHMELPPGAEDLEVDEASGRRSGPSPFTLIWVLLLIGGYLYRSCAS
jgi:hypothetical protein